MTGRRQIDPLELRHFAAPAERAHVDSALSADRIGQVRRAHSHMCSTETSHQPECAHYASDHLTIPCTQPTFPHQSSLMLRSTSQAERVLCRRTHRPVRPVHIEGLTSILEAERMRAEALFSGTIAALRKPSWELAERELIGPLDAALSDEPAAQYAKCAHQLHVLVHLHWRIGPERSAAKVRTITAEMSRSGVRKTVAVALRNYLFDNLLPYGAVLHVVESDFTLRPCDVQSLLDRYGWSKRCPVSREHMHRLLCTVLRTLADFRAIAQDSEDTVKERAYISPERRCEVETTLLGANERLKNSLHRISLAHREHFSEHLIEMMRFEIGRRAATVTEEIRQRLDQGSAQLESSSASPCDGGHEREARVASSPASVRERCERLHAGLATYAWSRAHQPDGRPGLAWLADG